MEYKVGRLVANTCWVCYNPKMKITRLKKFEDNNGYTNFFIWCKCNKCGAVDDIIRESKEENMI